MNPLNIADGAAILAVVARDISQWLLGVVGDVRSVDTKILALSNEVASLAGLLGSVERTVKDCHAQPLTLAHLDEDMWQQINTTLSDCKTTLEELQRLLLRVNGEQDTDASSLRKLLKKPGMFFRFNIYEEEITTYVGRIEKSNAAIQTSLAVVNISLTFRANASQERVFQELRHLKTLFEKILATPHQAKPSADAFSNRQSQNMQSLAVAARRFHGAASSTASTRLEGDRTSQAGSFWGGSELGDRLSDDQLRQIQRWNDLTTVEEEGDDATTESSQPNASTTSLSESTPPTSLGAEERPTGFAKGKNAETTRGRGLAIIESDSDDDSDVDHEVVCNLIEMASASFFAEQYGKTEERLRYVMEQHPEGRWDPRLLKTRLAFAYCLQDKWDEAAAAVSELPKTKEAANLHYFHLLQAIALAFLEGGQPSKAYGIGRSALQGKKKVLGKTSNEYYESLSIFAAICEAKGNAMEAEAMRHSLPTGWNTSTTTSQEYLNRMKNSGAIFPLPRSATPDINDNGTVHSRASEDTAVSLVHTQTTDTNASTAVTAEPSLEQSPGSESPGVPAHVSQGNLTREILGLFDLSAQVQQPPSLPARSVPAANPSITTFASAFPTYDQSPENVGQEGLKRGGLPPSAVSSSSTLDVTARQTQEPWPTRPAVHVPRSVQDSQKTERREGGSNVGDVDPFADWASRLFASTETQPALASRPKPAPALGGALGQHQRSLSALAGTMSQQNPGDNPAESLWLKFDQATSSAEALTGQPFPAASTTVGAPSQQTAITRVNVWSANVTDVPPIYATPYPGRLRMVSVNDGGNLRLPALYGQAEPKLSIPLRRLSYSSTFPTIAYFDRICEDEFRLETITLAAMDCPGEERVRLLKLAEYLNLPRHLRRGPVLFQFKTLLKKMVSLKRESKWADTSFFFTMGATHVFDFAEAFRNFEPDLSGSVGAQKTNEIDAELRLIAVRLGEMLLQFRPGEETARALICAVPDFILRLIGTCWRKAMARNLLFQRARLIPHSLAVIQYFASSTNFRFASNLATHSLDAAIVVLHCDDLAVECVPYRVRRGSVNLDFLHCDTSFMFEGAGWKHAEKKFAKIVEGKISQLRINDKKRIDLLKEKMLWHYCEEFGKQILPNFNNDGKEWSLRYDPRADPNPSAGIPITLSFSNQMIHACFEESVETTARMLSLTIKALQDDGHYPAHVLVAGPYAKSAHLRMRLETAAEPVKVWWPASGQEITAGTLGALDYGQNI